jgi:hypothetical protein
MYLVGTAGGAAWALRTIKLRSSKTFRQPKATVTWRKVRHFSEDVIPKFFVEPRRLETERIQNADDATVLSRNLFGAGD